MPENKVKVVSSKTRYNAAFEKSLLEKVPGADCDFVNGRYVNFVVNIQWEGFLMGVNYTRQTGMFIIGTLEDSKLKMSEKPAIHGGYKKACNEARRLAAINQDQRFIVFNSVSTFHEKKKKMPEAMEATLSVSESEGEGDE